MLHRRRLRIELIKLIGKESNSLEEVDAGTIHSTDTVNTKYLDCRRDEWQTMIVPALKKISISVLMKETGLSRGMFDTCFEYDDHLRANGHWGGGEALQPADNAVTLYWKDGKVATADGPYVETKEQLGGFLVLEAPDMNHAVQLMARSIRPRSTATFSRFDQRLT